MKDLDEQIPSILDNQVSITNLAARAAQGFTLREKRLFMAGLSKLDPRKEKDTLTLKERTFRVTAAEYAELSQIAEEKNAYRDLLSACEKLRTRYLRYKIATPLGYKERVFNWVGGLTYHHGEGWVEFSLTEEIMPHVCELSKHFTQYRLRQTSELRSIYSWRLLEMLTSHNDAKDETKVQIRRLLLTDLRSGLEIPDSYKYKDIRVRIIEAAVDELIKKDHWGIQWRPIKKGQAVTAIEFTFNREPPTKMIGNTPDRDQNTVDWADDLFKNSNFEN
jgi:plasmid replication initiation protein